MSLYADYLRERLGDEIIETLDGFVTYRFIEDGCTVYIVDIYVLPVARKLGVAKDLADKVAEIARDKGCTSMIGSVQVSALTSTDSLKVLLAYGMRLDRVVTDGIILRKDL